MDNPVANNGDPDQRLHHAASDLGLHCLPITLLRVSGKEGLNRRIYFYGNKFFPLRICPTDAWMQQYFSHIRTMRG